MVYFYLFIYFFPSLYFLCEVYKDKQTGEMWALESISESETMNKTLIYILLCLSLSGTTSNKPDTFFEHIIMDLQKLKSAPLIKSVSNELMLQFHTMLHIEICRYKLSFVSGRECISFLLLYDFSFLFRA